MELNSRNAITFIVGILGGAGTVYTVIYLRRRLRKSCTKLTHEQLIDQISLETLRKLSEVPNQSIRQCAFHILKARALKPEFLWILVQLCYAENEKCVLEACAVLESLTKNPECRARIVYVGGLEALSNVIYRSWRNKGEIYVNDCGKIQLLACMAIADLIINNNTSKLQLLDKNPSFLPSILGIMNDTSSRELEKWGLYLIHQITLCEATRDWLCQHWAVIKIVSKLVVKSQGEPLRLKLAFQVLVTLANILMANDEENVLKEIRSFGVIMPMIGCFKSDNHELVYWAVGLLHEFVTFNIALPEICAVPVLLRYLCNVLTFSEATIQRLVLRVLRHLCEFSDDFLIKTMHNKYFLARLPICLSSGDPDVRSWSLYLIHDIAKSGIEGILLLFEHAKGIVEALVEICARNVFNQDANTICRYIAETLGFLCSMETIQCEVVKAGALKAVLQISMMEDIDMKFWSASLLLNLSMCADVLKEEIVKNGAVKILIHLAVSDTDEPQIAIQAAKTLTMLEFLDSPFVIDLKSSSSSCSVLVNGSEHSPNELGINVVVLDPVTLNVEEKESFDTGHFPDAAIKLTEYIQSLPLMSVVFIVVRGEGNFFLTDDTKKALSSVGVSEYEYKTGELWVLCGQKHYGLKSSREIEFKHGHDDVDLTVNIPQGDFVIDQVEVLIIEPLLDVLMSTSPENNISKVSELMLLTLFARQDSHRIVMLEKEDFLEYLAKMICSMASRSLDELRTNSMIIAHCLGAMKTVAGLILSDTAPERCLRRGVLKEVLHLLCFINHTFLNAKDERKDFMKNSELSFLTSASPGFEEKAPFSSVCDSPASPARPVSAQGTEDSLPEDAKSNYDDFEESFMNLTELAVIILYHCNKKLDLPDDSVFTLSSVNVLWCTLLTCKEELRRAIAIPIENVITCEASRRKLLVEYSERQPVWLNEKEKTPELIVSSNRTEVINFNWTFESVHANVAVGRQRHSAGSSKPSGWYYEVQVMTDGIMQVGWRTRKCEYSPEKGIGVGDDVHSCAFDGARLKIWNGPACETVNNDYGEQWVANDIVSCLFSWHGEVSFWLNGVELGVAFSNMNPHLDYYPAVSLAMQQHCRFNFGGDKSFRYDMPEGYIAVNDVLEKKSTLKRPRSKSYTKGSFESIVEEDEESVEDVKNIHFTRMQRYSSSEPSLHGNANNRADSDEGNRRLSTASLNYDNEYPGTPLTPMSHVSFTPSSPFTPVSPLTPITPLTPVTPITPDTPLSLLRSPKSLNATPADSFSAIPSVYFEVEMKECGRRAKNVGYYCRTSRKNCSCEFHENQKMSFPSEVAKNVNLVSAPSVLGCGLLVPEGVFFTLDGVFNNIIHPLSDTAYEGDCLPYITYPNLKINYGQEEFLMERANAPKQRAASAKLLHSFSCSLLDRWSSEN